jgi:hypothetical protein
MKRLLLTFLLLSASAAFGQLYANTINATPQPYHSPDHTSHASYATMTEEHGIVGGGGFTFGQGERPVSDFPQMAAIPLGDSARELKKQHAQLKKSHKVWEN